MYECPICHKRYSAMYCDDCGKAIPREFKVIDDSERTSASDEGSGKIAKEEYDDLKRKLYAIESIAEDTNRKVKVIFFIVIASVIISLVSGIVMCINVSNALAAADTATSSYYWKY